MTNEQLNNCFAFLDRVTVTGHRERTAMNDLVQCLENLAKANNPEAPKVE